MFISELQLEKLNRKMINRVLFEGLDDDGVNGDVILVFGSITAVKYRVPKAVELYKANRAAKILMSGGHSELPEALAMKEAAMKQGVSEPHILVESQSTNTKENVIFSKELLDRLYGLKNVKRILVVTNYFHLRRCLLTLKKYMPEWVEFSTCGVLDINTRPENWWKNERGNNRVMNEMKRLIKYTRAGEIIDCEI